MYGILLLLLLILPLLFQVIYGRKAILESIKLNLSKVSLISFFSQILFSFFALNLLDYKIRSESDGQFHCGMPFVGLIIMELFFTALLIIAMLIQFSIRKSCNSNI